MAITQSSATIDQSERELLRQSELNKSILDNGATDRKGESLAGITSSFASNISDAIETYIADIDTEIEKMQEADSQKAFKGTGIDGALKTFVESVRTVANEYTAKLQSAEKQIINSVATVYNKQDEDISSSLTTDSGKLNDLNPQPKQQP